MGATHLNISAMLGAFYIGKNATSYFRTYMASEKMCRSIRGHAFFGAWLRAAHFFILPKIKIRWYLRWKAKLESINLILNLALMI